MRMRLRAISIACGCVS